MFVSSCQTDNYTKPPQNRENGNQRGFVGKHRSHSGGKMSVYPTLFFICSRFTALHRGKVNATHKTAPTTITRPEETTTNANIFHSFSNRIISSYLHSLQSYQYFLIPPADESVIFRQRRFRLPFPSWQQWWNPRNHQKDSELQMHGKRKHWLWSIFQSERHII